MCSADRLSAPASDLEESISEVERSDQEEPDRCHFVFRLCIGRAGVVLHTTRKCIGVCESANSKTVRSEKFASEKPGKCIFVFVYLGGKSASREHE